MRTSDKITPFYEPGANGIEAANLRQGTGYGATIARLGILALCFFAFLTVSAGLGAYFSSFFAPQSRWYYLTANVAQCVVGFAGASIASAYWMAYRPWSYLGATTSGGWRAYLGVLIVYLLCTPALNQLVWWNEHITLPESLHSLEEWMRQMEDTSARMTEVLLNSKSISGLISGILIIGVLTGVAEEFLFRGALQRTIATYAPLRHLSIWLAAFIFSAMHLQFFGFFPRFAMGVFFGYLLYSTGSIWPGVWAHALNNSLVVMAYWLSCRGYVEAESLSRWGVAESGFPWMAFVSTILTILFFTFFYNSFFRGQIKNAGIGKR